MRYFTFSVAGSAASLAILGILTLQQSFLLLFAGPPLLVAMLNGFVASVWQWKRGERYRTAAIVSTVAHALLAVLPLLMLIGPQGDLRF